MFQEDRSDLIAQITDVLNTMFLLCKHLSLYNEDNTVVEKTTDKLMKSIGRTHASGDNILVTVAKHRFLFQGEFLGRKNQLFTTFARRMFQHGISSFSLTPGLTVPSLYAFLRVLMRNAAETWDEGGIGASLQNRNIVGIQVTEMSESDFRLLDSTDDQDQTDDLQPSTDLWSRFARSIFNSLTGEELASLTAGESSPAELAERISELLVGRSVAEKDALTLELTSFVTTLQREKMKTVRTTALLNLADFINHLSDDLRKTVLGGICSLQMSAEYTEDFFNGLSDKAILDAFRQTTMQRGYTPPVVMSLITKLAGTRKLVSDVELAAPLSAQEERARKTKELFRPDEFKKYVPSQYQKALMQVLNNQQLPSGVSDKLQELKKSLEDSRLEQQVARLSLFILNNNPDEDYLKGLRDRLIGSMQFHLDAADYPNLIGFCRACFRDKNEEEPQLPADLIPDSFTKQVLGDVSRLGKEQQPQIAEVIALIGVPFIRPLIEFTALESDRSIRFFYLSCLKKLGHQVADHAALFLNDDRWFVQRNMLILLGELNAVDKLPKIRLLLNHSHQKVRQEALKTCLLLHDDDSIQKLINTLSSKNRQEVLHAITISKLVDNPNLSAELLNMLRAKELFRFDFDIKKALVQTLAEHKNPQALSVFSEMLNSRKIFKAGLYKKIKVEIIKALGKYPAAQVSPLLQQQIKNGVEDVASQARQILKKLPREDI